MIKELLEERIILENELNLLLIKVNNKKKKINDIKQRIEKDAFWLFWKWYNIFKFIPNTIYSKFPKIEYIDGKIMFKLFYEKCIDWNNSKSVEVIWKQSLSLYTGNDEIIDCLELTYDEIENKENTVEKWLLIKENNREK